MATITALTREDVLNEERNKTLAGLIQTEIEATILEITDPNLVVAEEIISRDENGNPIAKRDVKASKMLEGTKNTLKGKELRLEAIDKLLAKEGKKK